MISLVLLTSVIGILFNLSFTGLFTQPDWMLAVLLAILLSDKSTWYWVLPAMIIHDVLLYWTIWVTFPYMVVVAGILFFSDKRLGPGQPQRWFGLALVCMSLLIKGISVWDWLLTMMLAVWLWFVFSSIREREYVEST